MLLYKCGDNNQIGKSWGEGNPYVAYAYGLKAKVRNAGPSVLLKKQRSQSACSKAVNYVLTQKKNIAFHFRSSTDEISMPAMSAPIATIDGRVLDTLDRLIERHLFLESKIPRIPTINARESKCLISKFESY